MIAPTRLLVAAALAVLLPASTRADPRVGDSLLAPLKAFEATGARVGAAFLVDGRPVAILHGDVLLNPASVTKIFTAAAALDALGADRSFPTTVSAVGDGPRPDVLVVTPGGDPTIGAADLEALARCVREKGVAAAGALVVMDGPFTAEADPPAYDRKGTLAPYRAGVASFGVDRGAVVVTVSPGAPGAPPRVELSTTSDRVVVVNEAVTAARPGPKAKAKAKASSGTVGRGKFTLWGDVDGEGRLVLHLGGVFASKKPVVQAFRVPDPGAHAEGAFRHALEAAGVAIGGGPPPAAAPGEGRVLCTRPGPALKDVLVPMLKDSINPIAETVLRLVGTRAAGDRPVGFAEGGRALVSFLADRVGIPAVALRFTNGSGLYDANAVTPRATAVLVHWLRKTPAGAVVLDALPVAGVDGTMKKRLKGTPLAGCLRAKTGTLDDAVTLAGILPLDGGRVLEFAVLINGADCGARPKCPALDRFAARKATDDALLAAWKALGTSPAVP